MIGHTLGGENRGRIELVREPLRVGGGENLETGIAARSQVRDDLAVQRSSTIALQPHLHQLAVLHPRIAGDGNRIREGAIVWLHPGCFCLRPVDTEDELATPLHHLDHLAREPSVAPA